MSLTPQGVSGNSVGGDSSSSAWPSTLVAPGTIYHLGRWTGQTLRKLILSTATDSIVYGRVQIALDYPRGGLHPGNNALPNALVDLPLNFSPQHPIISLDFTPGLVTVLPGESIYLIVYDFMSTTSAAITWGLNMFWEPLGGER
ncbi:hypothetical protein phiKo_04 [Thermus phage phiKo]|nr:hypothetical protein phiKo_04 [Thermus phage phiKo]